MSDTNTEELELLFYDIMDDAEKAADSGNPEVMRDRLQSILDTASELQAKLANYRTQP